MTKKQFKEMCYDNVYTGGGRRINAFHFDHKAGEIDNRTYRGYKYRVSADTKDMTKKELFQAFYDWIYKEIELPWYVDYKFAETDEKRFKVSLSI